MISREERRQARRPISEPAQVAAIVAAFRAADAQLRTLPTSTAQERNFREGYSQAMRDLEREADERLESLGRERPVEWLTSPVEPAVSDEAVPCLVCKRPLTQESARRAAQVVGFSLDAPGARQMVQAFWARAGAHSQARHEGRAA